jgi:hypothetical protein
VPRLSIIIPAGDDVSLLEDTLASVLANRPAACEIIVPHAGTYEDPYELAGEVRFVEVPPGASQAAAIATAMAAARGEILHLLSPGCEVEEGWTKAALPHFADASVASVAPIVASALDRRQVLAVGVAWGAGGRRLEFGRGVGASPEQLAGLRILGPTSTAAFYRSGAIHQAGGWPTCVGSQLADIDAALSLGRLGYGSIVEPRTRIYCRTRISDDSGPFKQGRFQERMFWRHGAAGAATLAHPLVAAVNCLRAGGPLAMLSAAMGKTAAVLDIAVCLRHRRRLEQADRHAIINLDRDAAAADEASVPLVTRSRRAA